MIRAGLILLLCLPQTQEASYEQKRKHVDTHVGKAIDAGLRKLAEWQDPDGTFPSIRDRATHGTTALGLYTILALGGTLEDPSASKALDWMLRNPMDKELRNSETYQISLGAVALSYSVLAAGKDPRRAEIVSLLQRYTDWLVRTQRPGGGWGYGDDQENWHDHSNSQFAVLGLRAAANAGARVKKEVWERELTHYKTSQLADGGWGYATCYYRGETSTATMTAAGVMGLTLALASTGNKKPQEDPAIRRGISAMLVHWRQGSRRYLKPLGGEPYYLYSLERACMLTDQQRLGNVDWYVEGAWKILRQQKDDGVLGEGWGREAVASHCFDLLFLKRAYVPVATPSKPKPSAEPVDDKPREME